MFMFHLAVDKKRNFLPSILVMPMPLSSVHKAPHIQVQMAKPAMPFLLPVVLEPTPASA
jgi:hypothetical protein